MTDPKDGRRSTGRCRWPGAVVGLVSMAGGLAAAELLGAVAGASPVADVGNRVVDLAPVGLRSWAIDVFGTDDKAVLLGGVVAVLGAVAVLAGCWMVRGRTAAATAVVTATVTAGAAASLGRGGSGGWSAATTLLAGGVAVALLWWLGGSARRLREVSVPPSGSPPGSPPVIATVPGGVPGAVGRRRFLSVAAGVGAAAVVLGGGAAWLRSRGAVAAQRLGIRLPRPAVPLPEVAPAVEVGVPGVASFITPIDRFYRIDTALILPRVDLDDWSLRVHGRVVREIVLDHAGLLERPMIEVDATIACVSNEVGGDLVGTARWLGCRLDDLLSEAGIDPSADQVVGRSVDGFTAGFPVGALDGRDAIVAVGMNGEVLPLAHGYPARLMVPGLYGYVSATKWLAEIEVTRFDEFEAYWLPRGWDREAPVVTMSRIDVPNDGATVPADRPLAVGGVAWAPVRGIVGVEVQLDDGPWRAATPGAAHANTTWRQWKHVVTVGPGGHRIRVRALDGDGALQSSEVVPPGPNAATGWHTVRIDAV